ncbi:pyridoxal 5'-phosphate synthase glutaminase subunit PdxT [Natronocalculus amylovorans]|uniref:Pyridoxal 5'-phosphate synthase subunit PdxT n=1 Tax=Natronocalculus amylovorans TaxID=2917812 RepID=A0AAE3FVJ2_9EURY|nr:pyridoxal 5'-phosphate synthase glutaminase subunit PdxT [Natronocalculus amylovorans]MCL9815748.1 pyridoxal 5'-phosphate synthase glutaminase subunit PdxT [Natronocalculus amylovorans]
MTAETSSGTDADLRAGVIAVQGNVSEHAAAIKRAAFENGFSVIVEQIRQAGVVPNCDLLLLPGGESTTISRLLKREGIDAEIKQHVAAGKPILATCAGLIVSSSDAKDDRVTTLDILDVTVDRNAFGRQKDSFEAPLSIDGIDDPETPFPAVFIRAPLIDAIGDDVSVLAWWDENPVAVRQGPVLATSFHPELTPDDRLHRLAFFAEEIITDSPVHPETDV